MKIAYSVRAPISRICLMGVALAILALPLPALAALGGDVASVQVDQAQLKATRRTTAAAAYTVHEMQAPTGITVREYVSPAGKVFAVGWQGPRTPDLQQLLGTYFAQFKQANAEAHRGRVGHGPLTIQEPGLVVQTGGHMRAFMGRAYVPEMLPQGVRAEPLR